MIPIPFMVFLLSQYGVNGRGSVGRLRATTYLRQFCEEPHRQGPRVGEGFVRSLRRNDASRSVTYRETLRQKSVTDAFGASPKGVTCSQTPHETGVYGLAT